MVTHPSQQRPVLTYALLALNGLIFLFELSLGGQLEPFVRRWGTMPPDIRAYFQGLDSNPAALVTVLTSMFLHAGWLHLATNMLYLFIFGERVERAMGARAFLWLYLASGVVAGVLQVVAAPDLAVPAVGASGAIAGILGAYLALNPGATMAALAPRLFYGRAADVWTAALLALWLAGQALAGLLAISGAGQVQALGWWAHAGGFGAGLILAPVAIRWRRWDAGGGPPVGRLGTISSEWKEQSANGRAGDAVHAATRSGVGSTRPRPRSEDHLEARAAAGLWRRR